MAKQILIIRLSSIGDVLHCTPVASSLKAAWPDCKITWLVGEVSAELLKNNPDIDEIIVWSREKFEKCFRESRFKEALGMWRDLQKKLHDKEYYAVLDIHGLFLTGMIARQVNTHRRIGMTGTKELNSLFMTKTCRPLGSHITDKYLGVLEGLGIEEVNHRMHLILTAETRDFANEFLKRNSILPQEKILVLVLGTTWPAKNWPIAFFIQVVRLLHQDFKIILCGGKAEIQLGKEVERQAGASVLNAVGETTLLEMAGIIELASIVVAGDTGPLHIAGALAVPTIGMFGPTNPATYAPLGEQHGILTSQLSCSYCHKQRCPQGVDECMRNITPEAVVDKVYTLAR